MIRLKNLSIAGLLLVSAAAAGAGQLMAPPPAPVPVPRMPERPPMSPMSMASLISPDDYPQAAIDALEQGMVRVEVSVMSGGRVGRCRILKSSGSASLDAVTCRVLTSRTRFQPARDAVGNAVEGRVEQQIKWVLSSLAYESLAAISIGRTNAVGAVLYCYDHTLSPWCSEPPFDLFTMTVALTGAMPTSTDLVRTVTFTPGDQPPPAVVGVAQAGDTPLYSGSAQVAISRNGKVIKCVETTRVGGTSGALCGLAQHLLFKVDDADDETRTGLWSITLASRQPATGK